MSSHQHNRRAWDRLARQGHCLTRPAVDAGFARGLECIDPLGWLGSSLAGWRVLCLAAGGGKHGPLYAAAGGTVTVLDLSPEMLALDRQVAAERGCDLRIVEGSMDDLSVLEPAGFDLVIQPVSTCYVPDVGRVYREVARVTAPGGLYISQHKQPASLQADVRPSARGYELTEPYFRQGPLPEVLGSVHREPGTHEYLHRWEELLGGMCRAGFVIEDLIEPPHASPTAAPGEFGHRSQFVPPYVRIKARRVGGAGEPSRSAPLWVPAG